MGPAEQNSILSNDGGREGGRSHNIVGSSTRNVTPAAMVSHQSIPITPNKFITKKMQRTPGSTGVSLGHLAMKGKQDIGGSKLDKSS